MVGDRITVKKMKLDKMWGWGKSKIFEGAGKKGQACIYKIDEMTCCPSGYCFLQ